jgi:tetrahydromethanopterin S-methyltransferase subunit D
MPDETAEVGAADERQVDPTPPHKDDLPPVAVTFAKGVLVGLLLGGIAGGLVYAGARSQQPGKG